MAWVQHPQARQLPNSMRIVGKGPTSNSRGNPSVPRAQQQLAHAGQYHTHTLSLSHYCTFLPPPPPPISQIPSFIHTHLHYYVQKCSWEPCPMQLCSSHWPHSQQTKACLQAQRGGRSRLKQRQPLSRKRNSAGFPALPKKLATRLFAGEYIDFTYYLLQVR